MTKNLVRIYLPTTRRFPGARRYIIEDGLRMNPYTKIVDSEFEADYCINNYQCTKPHSHLIILDYSDSPSKDYTGKYFLYMKRSAVTKRDLVSIARSTVPFVLLMIIALLIVTYIPSISLVLTEWL